MPRVKKTEEKMSRQPAVAEDARISTGKNAKKSQSFLNDRRSVKAVVPSMAKSSSSIGSSASVSKTQKRKKTKGGNLTIDVYDVKGKVAGTMDLPIELFGAPVSPQLMAQAVRVYQANQRMGSAFAKTRGEVSYSTKKVWKQKGTGRARHGGRGAPIFVKGGAAHGPRPHDFSLTMPQKMRQKALFSALTSKLKDGEVKVVKGLDAIEPKTKVMAALLKNLSLINRKHSILFVVPTTVENVLRAAKNVENLDIMHAGQINTYAVLQHKTVLFMQQAVEKAKEQFVKTAK